MISAYSTRHQHSKTLSFASIFSTGFAGGAFVVEEVTIVPVINSGDLFAQKKRNDRNDEQELFMAVIFRNTEIIIRQKRPYFTVIIR
ncbi:MAG: hypothetical protein M3R17_10850 [Bacteroidota bacterium]|nr:hypothetical protein [Bacteroidota bacterium]